MSTLFTLVYGRFHSQPVSRNLLTIDNSVIVSDTFKFPIGSDRKNFTVYRTPVARHLVPLEKLMNGKMSEAKEGRAYLKDVDEHTFVRFAEYVYTGSYQPATSKFETNTNAARFPYICNKVWGAPKPNSKKGKLWDAFENRKYECAFSLAPVINLQHEDFTDVFLSHAQLYVFADRYDINRLKELCLCNLHGTLVQFTLYDKRVDDIIELIRYTYLNTADRQNSAEGLRSLVIHYAACVVEDLAKNPDFLTLPEEIGDAGRDLVAKMLERID